MSSHLGRVWLRLVSGAAAAFAVVGLLGPAPAAFAKSAAASPAATPAAGNVPGAQRIAGASRVDTAVAASKDQFSADGSAQAVVLARSDTFPDALAGGPLAAHVGGPLLLTTPGQLDKSAQDEIVRVAPKGATVYILGGPAAISTSVDTALAGLGYVPKRVFGANRFATAVAIADEMGDPTTVFEATGLNYPDALAGGPAAIKTGGVILLTNGKQQSDPTAAYLAAHPGGTHYALGGPAAAADPAATPLVGEDRFWTSVGVASQFFDPATTVGVATGYNFPDALAAGPDLASKDAPLILIQGSGALPEATTVWLFAQWRSLTKAIIFGGTRTIDDATMTQVGLLASAAARAAAADTSAQFTGAFGVMTEKQQVTGLTGDATVVVDASTGDVTTYHQGGATTRLPGGYAPRAQLAALPLDMDGLVAGVNALFQSYDDQLGLIAAGADTDELFTINAELVLLDPVAPPSVRYATYAALAADDGLTLVASGVKDSTGRVGIKTYSPLGADEGDASEISFIFDPATFMLLEESALDDQGDVNLRTTVLSLATTDTEPADPYSS